MHCRLGCIPAPARHLTGAGESGETDELIRGGGWGWMECRLAQ